MAKKTMVYIAQVELSDDETKKRWKPGDHVKSADFPAQVIENWLELGVLVEASNETFVDEKENQEGTK